ncbi:MAG: hypothetical protein WCN87_00390, partial [Chlamydiota bacterium]
MSTAAAATTPFDYKTYFGFESLERLQTAINIPPILEKLPQIGPIVSETLKLIIKNIDMLIKEMKDGKSLFVSVYKSPYPLRRSVALIKKEDGSSIFDVYVIFSRYRHGDPILGQGSSTRACLALHLSDTPKLAASLASCHEKAREGLEIQLSLQNLAPIPPVIAILGSYIKRDIPYTRSLQALYPETLSSFTTRHDLNPYIMARDTLKALSELHKAGVIHGDIKEDNILCSAEPFEHAVLTDFSDSHKVTDPFNWITHPFYIDPQLAALVIAAEGAIDDPSYIGSSSFESDVWAVGICFFRIMSRIQVSFVSQKKLLEGLGKSSSQSRIDSCKD